MRKKKTLSKEGNNNGGESELPVLTVLKPQASAENTLPPLKESIEQVASGPVWAALCFFYE